MDIRITHALPDDGPLSGSVKVGWLLSEERGGVIYDAPRRVRSAVVSRRHAKSASRCPAIIGLESRYFEVPCPFDLHLAFVRDKEGKPVLRNALGPKAPVRRKKLEALLHVTSEAEWRYPDRPTIQMRLPYVFIADEPVYMSQVDRPRSIGPVVMLVPSGIQHLPHGSGFAAGFPRALPLRVSALIQFRNARASGFSPDPGAVARK